MRFCLWSLKAHLQQSWGVPETYRGTLGQQGRFQPDATAQALNVQV